MDNKSQENQEQVGLGVVLPKWFVWLFSVIFMISAVTILPWVVWQTRVTMRLEIKIEELFTLKNRVDNIGVLISRIDSVNHRLTLIEKDMSTRDGKRWNQDDYERFVKPLLESHNIQIEELFRLIKDGK